MEEQQAAIKALSDENLKLNREKDGQNTQVGQFKERIRQLDDELLPEQHRQLKAMQDRLAEEFPCEYQENVGDIPQYQQEFDRLKRAEAVFLSKNSAALWSKAHRNRTLQRTNSSPRAESMPIGLSSMRSALKRWTTSMRLSSGA